jgi:hypothetical protein
MYQRFGADLSGGVWGPLNVPRIGRAREIYQERVVYMCILGPDGIITRHPKGGYPQTPRRTPWGDPAGGCPEEIPPGKLLAWGRLAWGL